MNESKEGTADDTFEDSLTLRVTMNEGTTSVTDDTFKDSLALKVEDGMKQSTTSADDQEGRFHDSIEYASSETSKDAGCWFRCWKKLGCVWVAQLSKTWPRSFALIFGVVGPVLLLICIALFFGYFLAELEKPSEIASNNEVIATRAEVAHKAAFIGNVTHEVPRICLSILARNDTSDPDFDLAAEIEEELDTILTRDDSVPFNASDEDLAGIDEEEVQNIFNFMRECGKKVWQGTEQFTSNATVNDIDSLSFNWIRCDGSGRAKNVSSSHFNRIFGSYIKHPYRDKTKLRPDVQEAAVVYAWQQHQRQLFNEYYEENLAEGMDPIDARIEARSESYQNADGFTGCESNPDAGAWFWFTVMTTIGYGNTSPVSQGGRALVYTVGFLSILTFACVLGNAGTIVTSIFDDWLGRVKLLSVFQTISWMKCIFWGILYYSWMAALAKYVEAWKEKRLGEEFDFSDAYWFSYITTTTVGLGDYYLEHSVLVRNDLVSFSLLILIGFIFLANFLVELTAILTKMIPHKKQNFNAALKETNMLCYCKKKQSEPGDKEGES